MAAAADDSDDEHPEKEPEFVIHVVEDHLQAPLPPIQMYWPAPAPLAAFQFQPEPQPLPELAHADAPKECTNCLILKYVHCILVTILVVVTLMMAMSLPKEYKKGYRGLIMACPILINVVALSWLTLSKYDKEQC